MNPINNAWIAATWFMTVCAVGGTYLAHDRHIGVFVAVVLAVLMTGQTIGADRAEREFRRRLAVSDSDRTEPKAEQ